MPVLVETQEASEVSETAIERAKQFVREHADMFTSFSEGEEDALIESLAESFQEAEEEGYRDGIADCPESDEEEDD